MKNKNLIITILLVVFVGGGGFFAGMKYQQSQRGQFANGQFGGRGMMGGANVSGNNGNRMGFRPVNGAIISSDDKSITVKLTDGSSKIVLLSATTVINKANVATKEDLKTGEKVAVFGQTNSDGSVTAQNIQLNPIARNLPDRNQP